MQSKADLNAGLYGDPGEGVNGELDFVFYDVACIGYPRFQNDEYPITVSPWHGRNKFTTFRM